MPLLFDEDAFEGISANDAARLLTKIEWLWTNRTIVTHQPLKEELAGLYKRRVGKYRIVYSYDENPDEMVIRLVGTRDDIYKRAKKR